MSTFSIGSLNQLGDALESANWTAEDVTKLKQFKELRRIKELLSGKAFIAYPEHIIDCDADPFVPEDWKVEEHKKGGQLKFDPAKILLHLFKNQKNGGVNGHDLWKKIFGKPLMNANILDYLLDHPELIPKDWKGKYIFFWGTIYRDPNNNLCVRYLRLGGSSSYWYHFLLDYNFGGECPAALEKLF